MRSALASVLLLLVAGCAHRATSETSAAHDDVELQNAYRMQQLTETIRRQIPRGDPGINISFIIVADTPGAARLTESYFGAGSDNQPSMSFDVFASKTNLFRRAVVIYQIKLPTADQTLSASTIWTYDGRTWSSPDADDAARTIFGLAAARASSGKPPLPVDPLTPLCAQSEYVVHAKAVSQTEPIPLALGVSYRIVTFEPVAAYKGVTVLSLMPVLRVSPQEQVSGRFINVIVTWQINLSEIRNPTYVVGIEYVLFLDYATTYLYTRSSVDELNPEHPWSGELEQKLQGILENLPLFNRFFGEHPTSAPIGPREFGPRE